MTHVTVSFSLHPKKHARILEWLDGEENTSQAIRDVLNAHVHGQVRLVDVLREVESVRRDLHALQRTGVTVTVEDDDEPAETGDDEPAEAAAILDAFGKT